MINKKYLFLIPLVSIISVNAWGACPDVTKLNDMIGKTVTLRKVVGSSTILYPGDNSFYYNIDDKRIFLYRIHQTVQISKVKWMDTKCSCVKVSYKNLLGDSYEELQLTLQTTSGSGLTNLQIDTFLTTAFIGDTINDNFNYFFRCSYSHLIHSSLCNHKCSSAHFSYLSQSDLIYDSLCTSCLSPVFLMPDYELEKGIANIFTSYCFSRYRELNDTLSLKLIDSTARIVLTNWPFPLRGYDYRFILLDEPIPNATACPAGTIFVNSGLLKMIDTPKELEAVLCHEIAHVELRHGYRQFKKLQSDTRLTNILGAVTGAAVGVATKSNNNGIIAGAFAQAIADLAAEISSAGYSRDLEEEADRLVQLYSQHTVGSPHNSSYTTLLRKLQYYSNELPNKLYSSTFSSHPDLEKRIKANETITFAQLDAPIRYSGFDKYGHLVATLKVMAISQVPTIIKQTNYYADKEYAAAHEVTVFAEINTTPYLGKVTEVKHFFLDSISSKFNSLAKPEGYKFENNEDTKLYPGQQAGIVFYSNAHPVWPLRWDDSTRFALPLQNVVQWLKQ